VADQNLQARYGILSFSVVLLSLTLLLRHYQSNQRRRTNTQSRSGSDVEEERMFVDDTDASSISSAIHSPRSEFSPGPSTLRPPNSDENEAAAQILLLTRQFAYIVRALLLYDPKTALDAIDELPEEQKMAPWVCALVGRARFELNDYDQVSHCSVSFRHRDFLFCFWI